MESRFEIPGVGDADSLAYYLEAKYKFMPEFYAALRWNQQFFSNVPTRSGGTTAWDNDVWRIDAALAYRFTAHTQLKLQYSLQNERGSHSQSFPLAVQFTMRF